MSDPSSTHAKTPACPLLKPRFWQECCPTTPILDRLAIVNRKIILGCPLALTPTRQYLMDQERIEKKGDHNIVRDPTAGHLDD